MAMIGVFFNELLKTCQMALMSLFNSPTSVFTSIVFGGKRGITHSHYHREVFHVLRRWRRSQRGGDGRDLVATVATRWRRSRRGGDGRDEVATVATRWRRSRSGWGWRSPIAVATCQAYTRVTPMDYVRPMLASRSGRATGHSPQADNHT
jgi:hypothetical protein